MQENGIINGNDENSNKCKCIIVEYWSWNVSVVVGDCYVVGKQYRDIIIFVEIMWLRQ